LKSHWDFIVVPLLAALMVCEGGVTPSWKQPGELAA